MAESRIGGLYIEITARAGKAIADLRRVGGAIAGVRSRVSGAIGLGGGLGARSVATFGSDLPTAMGVGGFAAGARKGMRRALPGGLGSGFAMGVGGMAGMGVIYAAAVATRKFAESVALVSPEAREAGNALQNQVNSMFDNFASQTAPATVEAMKGLGAALDSFSTAMTMIGEKIRDTVNYSKESQAEVFEAKAARPLGWWDMRYAKQLAAENNISIDTASKIIQNSYLAQAQKIREEIGQGAQKFTPAESERLRKQKEKEAQDKEDRRPLYGPELPPGYGRSKEEREDERERGIGFTSLEGLQNEMIQRQNVADLAAQQLEAQQRTNVLLERVLQKDLALK